MGVDVSRWFRHYAGMMRDDKLVRVAIRSGQTVERVVWIWGAILESAAEIDDAGKYDLDAAEAAYFLRASEDDVVGILHELEVAGRVAGGVVVKWSNRQFQSDRSAERVARHRAKKRQDSVGDDKCNDAVTLQDSPCNAPETETELETEDSEDTIVPSAAVAAKIPNAIELRAAVFNSGVALLTGSGSTEKQARSMLGRWRNDHGDPAVLDALAAATANEISEPIPWIRRRLETINGQRNRLRGTRPDPALDLLRQGDAQLAAERSREAPDWGTRTSLPAVRSG